MVSWQIVFTRQAQKDAKKISASGLRRKAEELLVKVARQRARVGAADQAVARRLGRRGAAHLDLTHGLAGGGRRGGADQLYSGFRFGRRGHILDQPLTMP